MHSSSCTLVQRKGWDPVSFNVVLVKVRPGDKEELSPRSPNQNLNPKFLTPSLVIKGPSPFRNGAPKTEKSSSPWSPITVSGFSSDEKLGR